MAPAASAVPTAAPGPGFQPPLRIDRALDVLNAPGSTRQKFQALFNSSNFGPGDLEEVSPELWEELRLDNAGAEYDLLGRDQAEEEAQGARREIPVKDVPRTTLAGLEATSPELHTDIAIELRSVRDMDPREPEPPLMSESETSFRSEDPPGSQGPGDAVSGASSMPRTAQVKRPPPSSQNVALAGCLSC